MGKSPGRWLKSVLFGKKSSKSHASKSRDVSSAGKGPPAVLAVGSPTISQPIPVSTDRSGADLELENGVAGASSGVGSLPVNPDGEKHATAGSISSNDVEKSIEEKAATKAQAAFRGYLARRAFRALKGIIRLQALIRGHLVRRQAIATLRSTQAIVKLQALFRGRRARLSDSHLKKTRSLGSLGLSQSSRKEKLTANVFVRKLLSSSSTAMPLRIQYGSGEPNSAHVWVERWTSIHFWEPLPQPKNNLKPHSKLGKNHAIETESSRPKRSVRRMSTTNYDPVSATLTSESEKSKRNPRKVSSYSVDSVQDHPHSELEKVKRNLRKVSSAVVETSDRSEAEPEKPKRIPKKVISPPNDATVQAVEESVELTKTDTTAATETKLDEEVVTRAVVDDEPLDVSQHDQALVELPPLVSMGKDENLPVTNDETVSKEDQANSENLKGSRRRSSFSAKSEYMENGLQNTLTIPSYMATTESAKAKLRGQNSPRFGSDAAEKNGYTRRHSLPSSTNGKVTSLSPRTQRLVQTNGKGAIRSDRSLLSSRDGNEKPIQVEWRR
ncbi:Protein IQ-DOMAIN 31 [Acorus gramineus]|uniref:Protein IQ-DOMAIN 31 n=1 Tax=Acorus gramineus TaxID=55184 RepID=A0AAV9A487_ACOGR|nr:Protein IQ-DOMAIN 31 [Acorus gramineus]